MKTKSIFSFLFLLAMVLPAYADQFEGKIGQLDFSVSLNIRGGTSVAGTCRYPSRPGIIYILKGELRDNGQRMILREYEGERIISTMTLTYGAPNGKPRWAGTAKSSDGRDLEVWFRQ